MNQISVTNGEDDGSMTDAHLEGFKASLRRTLEQQSQQTYHQQGQTAASSSFATTKRAAIKPRHNGPTTKFTSSVSAVDHLDEPPSSSSIQFAQRKNVSENEETLNGDLALRTEPLGKSTDYRNAISLVAGVKPYRYMFEKITEKAEALDDRIDTFAELYRKTYPETDFHNPKYPSQAIVTVIGRICSDANEGKSNERSLVLETSRSLGGGSRVKLDVSELTGFSFFPGQIVVLSGINATGSVFAVTQVHQMGPFISSQHPLILSGNVDATPEEYFKEFILSPLSRHQERFPKEMQILLVPSLQDILHETIVLPQPELEIRSLGLPPKTYCLSNPAQFAINEMVFAVNTADILMHLCGEEIARNPARTDRMGHVSKYLIDQRNMHPVYPGLTSEIESGVDFNQYDLMDLRVCPDVVILPSKLKSFAKISDNVVFVNPNQLSKAHAGGTFARLTIHPISQTALDEALVSSMDEDDEQSTSVYHQVYSRCRVDIVRV
ncbi:DNA-directed DNA polymerase alpha subunit pol12 [Entomortierella lignicola]|nr:DNA-directed DNA polymerase alpha subunit pol12 [Entomortierella lignicola]